MREPRRVWQATVARVSGLGSVVVLIVVSLVVLGWFGLVGSVSGEGGNGEVVVAGENPAGADQPEPELPDTGQDSETDTGLDVETVDPVGNDPGDDPAPTSTRPPSPSQPDPGIDNLVREFVLSPWGGETLGSDYELSTYARLESNDADIRHRAEFEWEVLVELISKIFDNPHYGQLHRMMNDNLEACGIDHGLPPVAEFFQLSEEQQQAAYEDLGLVGDRMAQLEVKCWSRARIYAGKDAETDRLLGLLHQDLLSVAQDWVDANPDKVVPFAE